MDALLAALRACAEPTRLRLLALAARGAFCVVELTDILGQSQPRLSRHLKLLCDAGLLERVREGANVWFGLPPDAGLVHELLARIPEHDPVLAADRRGAARVLAERARIASESFRKQGADWDEMRALGLPAAQVEAALVSLLPAEGLGRVLDVGTGTGRLLELLATRVRAGIGIDASRAMLALARTRLAKPGLGHLTVRQADMYSLPLASRFDLVVMQMVLHYAEDPEAALAEAARVMAPGGQMIVVDLAWHGRSELAEGLAHRWPGFRDESITSLFARHGLVPGASLSVPGPFEVRLWSGILPAAAAASATLELAQ
ncbi:MAG: ArsR family transcriptional regulator [Acetobacteraceae bacterium]|nr:ArsR family transcriptional regulator [Acetobacteraceae bacterium]